MDYTLAEYKHPAYDEMIYELCKQRLLEQGYPASIESLRYEHAFAIRCLFVDRKLGNLLKIGKFGEILQCMHGRTPLSKVRLAVLRNCLRLTKHNALGASCASARRVQAEAVRFYPAMQIRDHDIGKRFFPQETLFSMPECCLFADLIDHLEKEHQNKRGDEIEAPAANVDDAKTKAAAAGAAASKNEMLKCDLHMTYKHLHIDVREATDW